MSSPVVRPRRADDLPALETLLEAQQPTSRYPLVWPLPEPVRDFLVRPDELAAFVAEVDGRVAGHVSATRVREGELGALWSAAARRPVAELACVSVLFVDHTVIRRGLGSALLDTVEGWMHDAGLTPVLDVVSTNPRPIEVYRRRGWRDIGIVRTEWLPADEPPVLMMVLDTHH